MGSRIWHKMKISLPNTVAFLFLLYSVAVLRVFFKLLYFHSPTKPKRKQRTELNPFKKIYLIPIPQKAGILSGWLRTASTGQLLKHLPCKRILEGLTINAQLKLFKCDIFLLRKSSAKNYLTNYSLRRLQELNYLVPRQTKFPRGKVGTCAWVVHTTFQRTLTGHFT